MAKTAFYIGPSGSGKTSSVRTLNPETTFIFNTLSKDLPWRGSAKQYFAVKTKGEKPNVEWESGNMVSTSQSAAVLAWLHFINVKMPHIRDIVLDDNTFLTSFELLRRKDEKNYDKFNDIANNFVNIVSAARELRSDLVVHILHHTRVDGDGLIEDKKIRAASFGKLVDTSLQTQEAQFTLVLRSEKETGDKDIDYVFYTRDADSSAKTPFGMFETAKIPNDMKLVSDTIRCYYEGENCA